MYDMIRNTDEYIVTFLTLVICLMSFVMFSIYDKFASCVFFVLLRFLCKETESVIVLHGKADFWDFRLLIYISVFYLRDTGVKFVLLNANEI